VGGAHPKKVNQGMKTAVNTDEKVMRRKRRWRVIAINSMAVIGALGLFALLGFVGKNQSETRCHSIEINIKNPNGHAFVSESEVMKSVLQDGDSLQGELIKDIKLEEIHQAVMSNGAIREAHVYTTVDGRLRVDIEQKTPIARIINANGQSFYLDEQGFTMPLSDLYSADVPLFTGNLTEKMRDRSILELKNDTNFVNHSKLDDIFEITKYISSNEFWSAQVEHIYLNSNGDFVIVPRVGEHRIVLGSAENLENKFKKLMAFYVDVMPVKNLNHIKTINLKYRKQVVCEK
jgi:cell division protein FtsQ